MSHIEEIKFTEWQPVLRQFEAKEDNVSLDRETDLYKLLSHVIEYAIVATVTDQGKEGMTHMAMATITRRPLRWTAPTS
jgi:hypothetical protein